ncbi:MAG: DUF3810 domain-containing protein [Christensenellaceae bacterium]|nr:DUF3810 domain-containing protein [Christensenellaceae bacterium]
MAKHNETEYYQSSESDHAPMHRRHRFSARKYTWRYQLCRLPWLLLIVLGLMLPRMVDGNPAEVERIYSRMIYPVVSGIIAAITSIFPFSLAETLIIIVPVVLVSVLIIRLLKLVFGKLSARHHNRIRFFSFLISLGIFAGVMLNLFYCMWGFNHYRLPASELLKLNSTERSVEQLAAVYEELAKQAAELRAQVDEDDKGIYTIGDHDKAFECVAQAYANLGEQNDLFSSTAYRAKFVRLSEYMSRAGIAGIYIPYTAEMNVNVHQPDLYILSGAAHETAHYMGFAREDEANFFAYYVSLFSDDIALKYSSTMHALINCGNKLYEKDSGLYFEIREQIYTDGMNRDLNEYRMYYAAYEDEPAKQVSDSINDAYLQYNGQDDGIQSYGRMVDLVLAYFESIGFFEPMGFFD